ncbi:hypothetical protein [Agarivorans sp.]
MAVIALEIDDTGSMRIGKRVFKHVLVIPGIVTIVRAVVLGFVFAG